MNKLIRVIIPPIVGYICYQLCDFIYEIIFPMAPIDDFSASGIFFLLDIIAMVIWIGFVFIFQYKVIVPKTMLSINKALITTVIIGFFIGTLFGVGHYFIDNASPLKSVISFFRIIVQFYSFWIGNLIVIGILNTTFNNRFQADDDTGQKEKINEA